MSNQVADADGSRRSLILSFVLVFLVLPTIVFYFSYVRAERQLHDAKNIKIDGFVLAPAKQITDFRLTDSNGGAFNKAKLRGHWTLMFFGFTNCAKVCPTTLVALNTMYKTLQKDLPAEKLPQVMLVSVDPERDSVARLKGYVGSFNPRFIGATGTEADLTALEKQMHIVAVKVQAGSGKNDYYYDHSAEILLINPNAEVQAYMSYPHQPEQMVKDYKLILSTITL